MRQLTLNEKINMKGAFERQGLTGLSHLDMGLAVHFWGICYGYVPLSECHVLARPVAKAYRHKKRRSALG